MAQAARLSLRMQKELKLLLSDPPPGAAFPSLSADSDLSSLDAQLEGPEGTVYAKGVFNLKIQIPERYPFQPPIVTFATPIYHPNIDTGGRICLDILNLPPKGAWQPSLNISTVLTSIGLLLSEPNPDDGLMCDASREYKYNRQAFDQKARAMTEQYAKAGACGQNSSIQCEKSNTDLRTMMEVGGSDKVPKTELANFVSSQEKPHGISENQSLESSSSTVKGENNREENVHLPLNPETQLEAKGWSKGLRNMADKDSHRHKELCGTGRKLSLGSSVQTHQKDGNEMGDTASKVSNSIRNPQTTFMASWGLSPEQLGDCHEDLDQHLDKLVCDSKTICPEKLSQISNTMPPGSFDERPSIETVEKKTILASELFSGPQPSMLPSNSVKRESRKDHGVRVGNGPADSMFKKVSLSYKKLSLGLKGSSQGPRMVDKENHVPISVTSTAKKTVIGQKLSLGPLTQLQGSNDDNSQLLLQPQHFSTVVSKKQKSNLLDFEKVIGENQQGQEESQSAESVIVLDSEDSEEENNGLIRSKSLLSRKRALKRRA